MITLIMEYVSKDTGIINETCSNQYNPDEERIPMSAKCSCEDVSSPESSDRAYSDENDTQKLLRAIRHCCASKGLRDPYRTLLEQSSITIYGLIGKAEAQCGVLKQCQSEREVYVEKWHAEQKLSKSNENKIVEIKEDAIYLASKLKAATIEIDRLTKISVEKDQMARELSKKNKIIEYSVKDTQELENELKYLKSKLSDLEELQNTSNNKCNELSAENARLVSELEILKTTNIENDKNVDDLSKEIVDLRAIIDSSDVQRIAFEKEITGLKEAYCALESKSDGLLNESNDLIITLREELANSRTNLVSIRKCLKKKNDLNEKLIQDIESLEQKVQHFDKNEDNKSQIDSSTNEFITKDIDLEEKAGTSVIQLNEIHKENDKLNQHVAQITRENEELKKRIAQISIDLVAQKVERDEMALKSNELVEKCYKLEQEISSKRPLSVQDNGVQVNLCCHCQLKAKICECESCTNLTDPCSCTSTTCSCISSDPGVPVKCDCIDKDKRTSQCRPNEILVLCNEIDDTMKITPSDAEQRYCEIELELKQRMVELKSLYQNMEEANIKIDIYKATITQNEMELKKYQSRGMIIFSSAK